MDAERRLPSERRRPRIVFRLRERRSGFDRRHGEGALQHLRDDPMLLLAALVVLNALSAADWSLTCRALSHGATEANMVLGGLISTDPTLAAAFKAAVMLGVSALVWRERRYRLVLAAALFGLGVYCALILYHFAGLASIGAT